MKFHKSILKHSAISVILFTACFQNCMDVPRDNAADRGGDNYSDIYSDNRITEFLFGDLQVNGVINDVDNTILVPVLYGSDVTAIAPEFTTNAESVVVEGREQKSGITTNNYSEPLIYKVTARDSSYREYTVSVREVSIVSFRLTDPALSWENGTDGVIDYDNNTIYVPVPFYMNITRLIIIFNAIGNISLNDTLQESGITENDFTNAGTAPLEYVVQDANGVTEEYTVTVACKEPEAAHFAGSLGGVGSSDGTGGAASFRGPCSITSDMNSLYVADELNHIIRKIAISTGAVTTFAGSPAQYGTDDGTGSAARFNCPSGITTDGINLYVADRLNHAIRKIVISTREVTTIAGEWYDVAYGGLSNDDPDGYTNGIASRFYYPAGITTDGVNLYVADSDNNKIRRIEIYTGIVSTLAGTGSGGFNNDTDGTTWDDFNKVYNDIESQFYSPWGITIDANGENLYVSDTTNNTIRRIDISTGIVSTFAGSESPALYGSNDDPDGTLNVPPETLPVIDSTFWSPMGIAADEESLYITDTGNSTIRRIVISSGVVSTFAGFAYTSIYAQYYDGMGNGAAFYGPRGITVRNGVLYVADTGNSIIRKISQDRMVSTMAGLVNEPGVDDGTGTAARFALPWSVTEAGNYLYVCDASETVDHYKIRRINKTSGEVTTFYNSGGSNFVGITTDGTYLYVCDTSNGLIRRIEISSGNLQDSIASGCGYPFGITTDGTNLYVTDGSYNSVIRKIAISSPADNTVIAGTGAPGSSDGTGTAAEFNYPQGITTDGTNLYVADYRNQTIRRIAISSGVVTTIAGAVSSYGGHADDLNGNADVIISSEFRNPCGITTDGANLYVSEGILSGENTKSYIIRKIVISSGVVTTLAGTYELEGCNDGSVSAALFNNPAGLVFSYSDQKLYICDMGNNAVRVVNP